MLPTYVFSKLTGRDIGVCPIHGQIPPLGVHSPPHAQLPSLLFQQLSFSRLSGFVRNKQ